MNTTERKEMLSDLAYEEIKSSELFNQLDGEGLKTETENLAAAIERTVENWFARRLSDEANAERIEALIGFAEAAQTAGLSLSNFAVAQQRAIAQAHITAQAKNELAERLIDSQDEWRVVAPQVVSFTSPSLKSCREMELEQNNGI